jgi:energy-converting hydrogenase Eha subunit H
MISKKLFIYVSDFCNGILLSFAMVPLYDSPALIVPYRSLWSLFTIARLLSSATIDYRKTSTCDAFLTICSILGIASYPYEMI